MTSNNKDFYVFEVCIVGVQRNNFFQLTKIIKQWNYYLNLYNKVILCYKILNPHAKLILISTNLK